MKLLITGAAGFSEEQISRIKKLGHEVYYLQQEKDKLPLSYDQIEAVIGNGLFLHQDIHMFRNLKYIQLTSAGFDRVPLSYIQKKGIKIYNAHGVYSVPMAEYVIASVFMFYKNLNFFIDNQRNHIWKKNRNLIDLYEKNVAIIGCGSVGEECAKRFAAFGCIVTGVDIRPNLSSIFNEFVLMDELDKALSEAEIIVLTLPLTEETRHLINKDKFSLMREGSILVNVSRGEIIDTDALVSCLSEKNIYAVLDVYEEEPLPSNHPLWNLKNVFLTPHNSFVSSKNTSRLFDLTMKNLMNWSKENETKEHTDFGK